MAANTTIASNLLHKNEKKVLKVLINFFGHKTLMKFRTQGFEQ